MTDPEIEYARLVSGDAAAVRARAEDLMAGTRDLLGVRTDLADAQDVPVWSGAAATAFVGRAAGLRHGLSLTRVALDRADHYIGYWRNRPSGLPPVVEELYARVINARLLSVGSTYNQQLAGVEAVLTGDDVDLDSLTRRPGSGSRRACARTRSGSPATTAASVRSSPTPPPPATTAGSSRRAWATTPTR